MDIRTDGQTDRQILICLIFVYNDGTGFNRFQFVFIGGHRSNRTASLCLNRIGYVLTIMFTVCFTIVYTCL